MQNDDIHFTFKMIVVFELIFINCYNLLPRSYEKPEKYCNTTSKNVKCAYINNHILMLIERAIHVAHNLCFLSYFYSLILPF